MFEQDYGQVDGVTIGFLLAQQWQVFLLCPNESIWMKVFAWKMC